MPGRDTSGWTKEDWLIQRYKYVPSEPTAIAFAAIFGLTTLVHLFQLVTSKTLYFIPFLMGGLCKCPLEQKADVLRLTLRHQQSKLQATFCAQLMLKRQI